MLKIIFGPSGTSVVVPGEPRQDGWARVHSVQHHRVPAAAAAQPVPGIPSGPGKRSPNEVDPAVVPRSRGSIVPPVRSGCDFCDDAHILVHSQLSAD